MSLGSNSLGKPNTLYELGGVLIDQGRYRAAEDIIRRLVSNYESKHSSSSNTNVETLKASDLLAGLYTDFQEGLVKLKSHDQRWDQILIQLDDVGIIGIGQYDSKSSIRNGGGYVQVLFTQGRDIWVTLEVRALIF